MKGVAFKVNYNDGGANGGLIGYRGVCSDRIIVQNVKIDPRPWCSNKGCDCRIYCDNDLLGPRPTGQPCYESALLGPPFRFGAGFFHAGERAETPMRINGVDPGDIAFLTTILPGGEQEDRIIFGCYRVKEISGDDDQGYFVESDETMDIRLPDDVARDCFYWDYQRPNSDGSKKWGSGLHRYLDEECTRKLIEDLLWRLGDDPGRDRLFRAFDGEIFSQRTTTPYGRSGEESDEHRELKKLVASKPERLGLPKRSRPTIEHSFLSGDRVDVKFDLPNNKAAVVEVETEVPLPGAHQAVKYRALLEVERGDALGTGDVQAILVAHCFDEETRKLAEQYDIKLVVL